MPDPDWDATEDDPPPGWVAPNHRQRNLAELAWLVAVGAVAGLFPHDRLEIELGAIGLGAITALYGHIAGAIYDDWQDDYRGATRLASMAGPVACIVAVSAFLFVSLMRA